MLGRTGVGDVNRSSRVLALGCLSLLLTACAAGKPKAGGKASPEHGGSDAVHASLTGTKLEVDGFRGQLNIAGGGTQAPYNYAPSVLSENGTTKMWWCSQLPQTGPDGDDVLYARAPRIDGPYGANGAAATAALSGSGANGFDAKHTCDPSVLNVGGTYYMYYTGSAGDREHGNAIGLATSEDGVHWQRHQQPVVTPSMANTGTNTYGAGQPSALYLDGWFYLLYTDTSMGAAGPNGAGQFVLRAKDPSFTESAEQLSDTGFQAMGMVSPGHERNLVDAFSADWMYSDVLDAFALAHETEHGTQVTFFDQNLNRQPYEPVLLKGPWQEGPGLVRRPDGHAPDAGQRPGQRVPIDVVRATVTPEAPSNLSHFGLDVRSRG